MGQENQLIKKEDITTVVRIQIRKTDAQLSSLL